MSTVHLLGKLQKFGTSFPVSSKNIIGIFSLLECQIPGFRNFIIEAHEAGLDIAILSGDTIIEDPAELFLENIVREDVYISLIPAGSGFFKDILTAIAIFAISYFIPGGGAFAEAIRTGLRAVSIAIALKGIAGLLAKTPETQEEEKGPGIFDGPINTVKTGQPVPVLYGELLVGGAPIHVSLDTSNALVHGQPIIPDPSNPGVFESFPFSDDPLFWFNQSNNYFNNLRSLLEFLPI